MPEEAGQTVGLLEVVIPTFDRLWALPRVVQFYLDQPEIGRVIVVEDRSTDGTEAWLNEAARREPRLHPVRHERNRGASAARNTGADASRAPFVFFADDDMVLTPADGLAHMVGEMDRQKADIAVPVHIVPESGLPAELPPVEISFAGPSPRIFRPWTLELRSRAELAGTALPASFFSPLACGLMLMRRAVLDRVRYDEGLGATSYRDETDFQLKALHEGFRLLACARPVVVDLDRNAGGGGCHALNSLASYEWNAWKNNWKLLRRHRAVIRERIGLRAPVLVLQTCFVMHHLVHRLLRQYAGRILRACGLMKKL